MKKVIFIPGFLGTKLDYKFLNYFLKDKFDLIYFDYDTRLKDKIEVIAKKFRRFVNSIKLKKNEKIDIIALSVGGLISEYYLKFIDNKKVDKIVTIHSPFKGANFISLFSKELKGLQEIKKDSLFLKKLNKKHLIKVKELSLYSKYDYVVPGYSGKRGNSIKTYFFIHQLVHVWPPNVSKIIKFLKR